MQEVDNMRISVDESQMSVFFLDCFRFYRNDTGYNVFLNHCSVDIYENAIIEKCLWSQ